jgi:hypothetical protein
VTIGGLSLLDMGTAGWVGGVEQAAALLDTMVTCWSVAIPTRGAGWWMVAGGDGRRVPALVVAVVADEPPSWLRHGCQVRAERSSNALRVGGV